MEYRRYESVVSSFSGSSSDYDKSNDELSYDEDCYESKFFCQEETGSRLFRRWFLNIIDLPNSLTNRLKAWLRAPPGSRGSTNDKSSGTYSIRPSEIQLTGSAESDYENYDYEKYNRLRHGDGARKNYRAPGVHRPLKNHHVYHIYKQNEMKFQRGVGGQLDYSTSWLQRNGRFSSSPVLVLPRIDPDTGQPIFYPPSYHSRTSTERRSFTRRNENWRSDIWELKTNRYTHRRGDRDGIEDLANTQSSSKPKTIVELDPKSTKLDVTASTDFHETISMSSNHEDSQSFSRTVSVDEKNLGKIKTEDTVEKKSNEIPALLRVPSLTQPNVEELLRSLRQKINSLNAEKKFNDPLGHVTSLICPETGSRTRENFFKAHWQDKSDLFPKETRTTYGETRASFTERIQDIWIQEKTSSQWAVLHRHGTHVSANVNSKILNSEDILGEKKINRYAVGKNVRIDENENFKEEKEINRCIVDENMRIDGNEDSREKKIPRYGTDKNIKIVETEDFTIEKKINRDIADKNIKTVENDDFTKEKKVNLKTADKNNKTDETEDFTNENKINPDIVDNDTKIDIDKGFREKKINCNILEKNKKIDGNEDCQEKKIDCTEIESNSRGDDEALMSSFSSSNDNEISKPTVRNVAVQYCVQEANVSKESNRPLVLPSKNNADKSEIKINLLKPLDNYNKITVDSMQFPPPQEIEVFSQCWTEFSTDFPSSHPFIAIQSKPIDYTPEKLDLNPFEQSTQEKNFSLPQNTSRYIVDKISKLLFKMPAKKRLRNPLTKLPKIDLRPSIRFFRSKKLHYSKKIRSWFGKKFSSNRRSGSVCGRSKLGCMAIIFKCTEKSSESGLSAIVRPTPPTRRKHRVRSSTFTPIEAMLDSEKNKKSVLDEKSTNERAEEIGVDSSAIELSGNCKIHCERSMTTLSVTTSNSTNIPLQLLGSTSYTAVVPSHDSQDDFKQRPAEITTRKPEIETCEETDDRRTDLSSTTSNIRGDDKKSKILKFGDDLGIADFYAAKTKNDTVEKSERIDPARKIERSMENSPRDVEREKKINRRVVGKNLRIDGNDNFAEEKKINSEIADKNMIIDGNDFTEGTKTNRNIADKSMRIDRNDDFRGEKNFDRYIDHINMRIDGNKDFTKEKKFSRKIADKIVRIDGKEDFIGEKIINGKITDKSMGIDRNKDLTREKKFNRYNADMIILPTTTMKPKSERCQEIKDCHSDLSSIGANLRADEKSKIFEFGDVLKMSNSSDPKPKNRVDKKSSRVDPVKKISRSRENSPILRRRLRDTETEKIIVTQKRSLDIENLPSRKKIQNKIGQISLVEQSANSMRLNRRESIIDIAIDEFVKRVSSDKSANRKSLTNTLKDDLSVNRKEFKNLEKSQESQVRGLHSVGFYPELMPAATSKKLRRRADSPMIRNASDSRKRKNSTSCGSSLIPVGIEHSKLLSMTSKSDEKKNTRAREKKSAEDKNRNSLNSDDKNRNSLNSDDKNRNSFNSSENKRRNSLNSFEDNHGNSSNSSEDKKRNSLNSSEDKIRNSLNSSEDKIRKSLNSSVDKNLKSLNSSEDKIRNSLNSEKWRPSLKKSTSYSAGSGSKKMSNNRVHFELEKCSSKETASTSGLKQKIVECEYDDPSKKMIYGSPLQKIDNKPPSKAESRSDLRQKIGKCDYDVSKKMIYGSSLREIDNKPPSKAESRSDLRLKIGKCDYDVSKKMIYGSSLREIDNKPPSKAESRSDLRLKIGKCDYDVSKKMIYGSSLREIDKNPPSKAESRSDLRQKIGKCDYDVSKKMIYGSPLREIDNKLLIVKINSSLANGMPLKRITIVDPQSVIERSKFDRAGRSRVKKSVIDWTGKSRANSPNLTSRSERTKAISRTDEPASRTCPRRATSLSRQIPKIVGSFEKRHPKENKLSYRSRSRHEDKSYSSDCPVQRTSEKFEEPIVDLAAIKERVENEILDKTSRTSGTEDSDCAIALIKAINSSMELSDVI